MTLVILISLVLRIAFIAQKVMLHIITQVAIALMTLQIIAHNVVMHTITHGV
jgi:hypothetical protein